MNGPSRAPGTTTWRLRPAVPGDVAGLARIESAVFGAEAWSQSLLAREVAACEGPGADRAYVVVEAVGRGGETAPGGRGAVLGYAGAWFGDGRGPADLLTIATVPEARRRGVATAMLDHLVALVADRGCDAVLLEVRASNEEAQRLYRAHGFEPISTRRRYYLDPVEDALVMRRVLGARPDGPEPL